MPHPVVAQCTLVCNNQLNLSLGPACQAEITYNLMLEGSSSCNPGGPDNFEVLVYDPTGLFVLPSSPFATINEIGQLLQVKTTHLPTGNFCWGSVLIQDLQPPVLTCPPPLTIECTEPTDPSATGYPLVQECFNFLLSHFDQYQDLGCSDPKGVTTRTWTASDINGNVGSCQQQIYISLPNVGNVTFPPSLDNIEAPALDCVDPDTDPANTGEPIIDGFPLPNDNGCSLSAFYSDQVVELCEASYSILRTWTVIEWCTGALESDLQVIKVEDAEGPQIECPPTVVVSTTSTVECVAEVVLPAAAISDNCSSGWEVTIASSVGFVAGNGGLLSAVPFGAYDLTYTATDSCGNASSCETVLDVVDQTAPTMICDQLASVTLGPSGMASVPVSVFDDGSFDNCCPLDFTGRRQTPACGLPDILSPTVTFCCEDVGTAVEVTVRATDCFDNWNECTVTVLVNDHVAPSIVCPTAVTLECTDDAENLLLTGEPTAYDGCGVDSIYFTDLAQLNDCQVGAIFRTWTTVDPYGNSASCQQTITVVDNSPIAVGYPPEYTANGCLSEAQLHPDSLPAPYDYPVVTGDDCELVGINFSDQVFTVAPGACLKIIRTWTLIDWCAYVPNSGSTAGLYTGTQILKIVDDDPPTLVCPADQLVTIADTSCAATVLLPAPQVVDCSAGATYEVSGDLGAGSGPFPGVVPGTYQAIYTATDHCGNATSCQISVQVVDGKAPTAYCKNGLVVELMPLDTDGDGIPDDGMLEVAASVFDNGSTDNCPGSLSFSFSAQPADSLRTVSCDDLGAVSLEMWVTDGSGNQDLCVVDLIVQDNQFACNGGQAPIIGGLISTEDGMGLPGVLVDLNDGLAPAVETGPGGSYIFEQLASGGDYTLTPAFDGDYLNGVTTWDLAYIKLHILGLQPLDSPYQIIAADANRSGSVTTLDIVDLQKLILRLVDTLPNDNPSWRFVDADYQFLDPADPLPEAFPEFRNVNNLVTDLTDADFRAIKVGDVNHSAAAQFGDGAEDRSAGSWPLQVESLRFSAGMEVEVALRTPEGGSFLGLQLALSFDPSVLQFRGLETEGGGWEYSDRHLERGWLPVSWLSVPAQSLPAGAELCKLRFRALAASDLSAALQIDPAGMAPELYLQDASLWRPELRFVPPAEPPSLRIAPNPFDQRTCLEFTNHTAGPVILQIVDPTGRTVWHQEKTLPAGRQEWVLTAGRELPEAGCYFLHLKTPDGPQTGRLLLR